MPNTSLERLTADRVLPDRHGAPRPVARILTVADSARDRTLGRPEGQRSFQRLFWALILVPSLLVALAAGPLAGVLAAPLLLALGILAGSMAARMRQCGAATLTALAGGAGALLWMATL